MVPDIPDSVISFVWQIFLPYVILLFMCFCANVVHIPFSYIGKSRLFLSLFRCVRFFRWKFRYKFH